MGHVVCYHKQFGIPFDPENLMALCHFWRVVGYMLGIDDRFNLCAGDDLDSIRSRCDAIFRHIIIPGLLLAPKDSPMMTDAYFDGLSGISTEFDSKKFTFITNRMTFVPGFYLTENECKDQVLYMKKYPHYIPNAWAIEEDMIKYPKRCKAFESLTWSHRWDIIFTDYLLLNCVPNSELLRKLFNFINTTRMFFLENLPVLAMFKFGYKNAWVRVLEDKKEL